MLPYQPTRRAALRIGGAGLLSLPQLLADEHFYEMLVKPRVLQGEHVPGIGISQVYEDTSVPQYANIRPLQ